MLNRFLWAVNPTYETHFESSHSSQNASNPGIKHFYLLYIEKCFIPGFGTFSKKLNRFYTWVFETFGRDSMARNMFYTWDFSPKEISLTSQMFYNKIFIPVLVKLKNESLSMTHPLTFSICYLIEWVIRKKRESREMSNFKNNLVFE